MNPNSLLEARHLTQVGELPYVYKLDFQVFGSTDRNPPTLPGSCESGRDRKSSWPQYCERVSPRCCGLKSSLGIIACSAVCQTSTAKCQYQNQIGFQKGPIALGAKLAENRAKGWLCSNRIAPKTGGKQKGLITGNNNNIKQSLVCPT